MNESILNKLGDEKSVICLVSLFGISLISYMFGYNKGFRIGTGTMCKMTNELIKSDARHILRIRQM